AAGHSDALLGDVAQRAMKTAHVVDEHVEIARREGAAEHFQDAEPDDSARGQRRDDVDAADVLGFEPGRLDAGANAFGTLAIELLLLKVLAAKRLDHSKRPYRLLRDR